MEFNNKIKKLLEDNISKQDLLDFDYEINNINEINLQKIKINTNNIIEKDILYNVSNKIHNFSVGDTINVAFRIKEKVHNYKGECIAIRGKGTNRIFNVRKVGAHNIGVERIIPLYSDCIESIEVIRRVRTKRVKVFCSKRKRGRMLLRKKNKTNTKSNKCVFKY